MHQSHLTGIWPMVLVEAKRDSTKMAESLAIVMVPEVGIEPTRGRPRGILSPVRLPVSPLRQLPNSYRNNASPVNLYSAAAEAFHAISSNFLHKALLNIL